MIRKLQTGNLRLIMLHVFCGWFAFFFASQSCASLCLVFWVALVLGFCCFLFAFLLLFFLRLFCDISAFLCVLGEGGG